MKKMLSIAVIAMLAMVVCMSTVYATTSFVVDLSASATKVDKGGEVEVTVALKNFTAGETGINAIHATIDYDKTVFETLEAADITALGGWSAPTFNPGNGEVVTDNATFMAENHDMLKIKFKVKDTAAVGNTVITFKSVNASDAVNDIYPSDQKITLTIQEKTVTPPANDTPKNEPVVQPQENIAQQNPTTGFEDYTVPAVLTISALGAIAYARYRRLEK